MKIVYSILSVTMFFVISGCAGLRQMNTGAENVNIYSSYPTQNCRFLGVIQNPTVHEVMDFRSSLQDLNTDTNNFLRNEGLRLGANIVVFTAHKSSKLHDRYVLGSKELTTIYIHSISANAYYCPSVRAAGIKQKNLEIDETPLTGAVQKNRL